MRDPFDKSDIFTRDVFQLMKIAPRPQKFKDWNLEWKLVMQYEWTIDWWVVILAATKDGQNRYFWTKESIGHDSNGQSLHEYRVKEIDQDPFTYPPDEQVSGLMKGAVWA